MDKQYQRNPRGPQCGNPYAPKLLTTFTEVPVWEYLVEFRTFLTSSLSIPETSKCSSPTSTNAVMGNHGLLFFLSLDFIGHS